MSKEWPEPNFQNGKIGPQPNLTAIYNTYIYMHIPPARAGLCMSVIISIFARAWVRALSASALLLCQCLLCWCADKSHAVCARQSVRPCIKVSKPVSSCQNRQMNALSACLGAPNACLPVYHMIHLPVSLFICLFVCRPSWPEPAFPRWRSSITHVLAIWLRAKTPTKATASTAADADASCTTVVNSRVINTPGRTSQEEARACLRVSATARYSKNLDAPKPQNHTIAMIANRYKIAQFEIAEHSTKSQSNRL